MKIPLAVSEAMFHHANVNRDDLHLALRHMAPYFLKGEFRKAWSDGNPTRYFDYVVTEWLAHFRAPAGSFAFRVAVPGQDAKHYFMRWPDGTIVDLTAEQFSEWELVDYAESKKASMPGTPTNRAKVLDTLLLAQQGLRSLP
jgi:hypothetical protein